MLTILAYCCLLIVVTKLIEVKELYENRVDKLYERYFNYQTEWVTEKFGPGRLKNIKGWLIKLTICCNNDGLQFLLCLKIILVQWM